MQAMDGAGCRKLCHVYIVGGKGIHNGRKQLHQLALKQGHFEGCPASWQEICANKTLTYRD